MVWPSTVSPFGRRCVMNRGSSPAACAVSRTLMLSPWPIRRSSLQARRHGVQRHLGARADGGNDRLPAQGEAAGKRVDAFDAHGVDALAYLVERTHAPFVPPPAADSPPARGAALTGHDRAALQLRFGAGQFVGGDAMVGQ